MEELGVLPKASTPAPVLLVQFLADRLGDYQKMARSLRAEGIGVEVYPEAKKVGQQLQYADRRGFRVALIAGPDEFAQDAWNVKDLRSADAAREGADGGGRGSHPRIVGRVTAGGSANGSQQSL